MPNQSLYPHDILQRGCTKVHLERNQLFPHMIGLSPLYQTHGSALKGSNPTDLHESVNPHFILVWHRSCGFGSGPCDYTHFHTSCLVTCALIAFASASILSDVNLATQTNSLPLYPKGIVQPWIKFWRQKSLATSSLQNLPFWLYNTVTVRFQVLFTSTSGFFSAFPHGTNLLSVSSRIQGQESLSPNFYDEYQRRILWKLHQPIDLHLRDYHPLWYVIPDNFSFISRLAYAAPKTTSLLYYYNRFSLPYAAFVRHYSRHHFCFLFLPLLRCFNSRSSFLQCK